jgi:hypothetical protein
MVIPTSLRLLAFVTALASASPLAQAQPAAPPANGETTLRRDMVPRAGMSVILRDGSKIGVVESIDGTPDGRVTAVNVTSGGILGFGAKLLAIPEGKFSVVGESVVVDMTARELSGLPRRGP